MRYVSVCSGIEAATVAWHPLGWSPLLFAEIAPFPSKVLAHHYPEVQNVGDFTTIPSRSDCDLLVGGTPCQAFSVAGLRAGLADARGNLALEFMRLADRLRPRWIVWENVPGVLSSNGGRDFGSILGALAELGYGFAYRVLDAQFFGVPQRRRRVFLVGHLGDWRAAAAVLFERESVRRDTPSRRKAGKDVAGMLGGSSGSRGRAPDTDRMTFIPEPWTLASGQANAPTLEGQAPTLTCLHEAPIVAFDPTQITSPGNRSTARGDISPTLAKMARPPHVAIGPPISVEHAGQILDELNRRRAIGSNARQDPVFSDGVVGALDTDPSTQAVCVTGEVTHALRAVGADASEDGTGRGTPITPVDAWRVRRLTPRECERLQGFPDDYTAIPGAADGPRYAALGNSMAVPVMHWIGKRIDFVDRLLRTRAGS